MIKKTEQEIMKDWSGQSTECPMVTIRCLAYNHEKYIERALDSFLAQKTNFPFIILVHEDASTDHTAEILRNYEKKYPKIIRVIYQEENQYSKHDGSITRILAKHIQGKYVALCECDDYWCNDNKLQMQYDFMEKTPACSLCVHNSVFHYVDGKREDHNFNYWTKLHRLTEQEVFLGWYVHTSSYFYRTNLDFAPEFTLRVRYWSGDYTKLTLAFYYGEVYCLPEVMSVYNANITSGVTVQNNCNGFDIYINRIIKRIEYLNEYNKFTMNRFNDIIQVRIAEDTIKISEDKGKLLQAARQIRHSQYYVDVVKSKKLTEKLKIFWKYNGYIFGTIWTTTVFLKRKILREIYNTKKSKL